MEPRLTKKEIDAASIGVEDGQGHHGRIADAQLRRALTWAKGKVNGIASKELTREMRELGIEPWIDTDLEQAQNHADTA